MNYSFRSVENTSGLMAEGEYECYVKSCGFTETKSGNPCIKFDFVVRSDVPQQYQNKHIFKNFYPDHATGQYPNDKIGRYANALGIAKDTEFELDDLIGRSCIVRISHFKGDDGQTRECIFYLAPSKVEPYMTDISTVSQYEELSDEDDDVPF